MHQCKGLIGWWDVESFRLDIDWLPSEDTRQNGGLLSDSLLHIVPDIGFQLTGSLPFGPQDPHIVNENVQPLAESRYDPGTRRLPVDFELEPDIPGLSSDDPGLTDNRYACVVTPGPTYAQLGQQLEALVLVCRSICHFFRCQPP
ncbi:uncharacterized protein N7525_010115 [Penicillium rubens]|uniref:uncharacterized protein n=1 Tax=Penicillium rubens TaxID=1108849 RepID=UPI002A59A3C5|nr:uncharacterized protein N7525_010115 [Penicillium rubens]KAJ5820831.1 hypothetical protein N7525_010115 [Penicillium rubens]